MDRWTLFTKFYNAFTEHYYTDFTGVGRKGFLYIDFTVSLDLDLDLELQYNIP